VNYENGYDISANRKEEQIRPNARRTNNKQFVSVSSVVYVVEWWQSTVIIHPSSWIKSTGTRIARWLLAFQFVGGCNVEQLLSVCYGVSLPTTSTAAVTTRR